MQNLFSSVSSFDPLSLSTQPQSQEDSTSQQHQQQQQQHQQQQQQYFSESNNNLDFVSDILFGQQQHPSTADTQNPINYNFPETSRLVEHSNSSSETLVGNTDTSSHFGSNDSIPNSLTHPYQHQQSQIQSLGASEQNKKLFFDRTTSEDLGLLTLRSNSDPTIALHSLQQARLQQQQSLGLTDISQNIPVPSQSNHQQITAAELLESTLPSFQETYPIKYNQLETFGLKMDEDCYNMAQAHQGNIGYHHGHQHHVMHQDQYDYQQNHSQFMAPNFYPYDQQSMVSLRHTIYVDFEINFFFCFLLILPNFSMDHRYRHKIVFHYHLFQMLTNFI